MAFKRSFAVLLLLAASAIASPHDSGSSSNPSKPGKGNSCSSNQFYYKDKDCCLPHGGPSTKPPSPPPGKSCPPSSHYWSKSLSCCVPSHPPPAHAPPPQCSNGHGWNSATQCCQPHSTPSHSHTTHKPSQTPGHGYPTTTHGGGHGTTTTHKGTTNHPTSTHKGDDHGKPTAYPQPPKGHNYKRRSASPLCPRSFEACPIDGLTSAAEYECLDTTAELKSCGGCASTGQGQDCTAIKGAWNVGCEAGSCAVYTCALGFKVSTDGKSCIAI